VQRVKLIPDLSLKVMGRSLRHDLSARGQAGSWRGPVVEACLCAQSRQRVPCLVSTGRLVSLCVQHDPHGRSEVLGLERACRVDSVVCH
jgi:hypothetical protein